MAAYLIVDIDVKDAARYEDYKQMVPASIEAFGGRYVARGGRTETLEGDWQPTRIAIVEFPSIERAREWLNSAEYRAARALRHATAHTRMIVIEGV